MVRALEQEQESYISRLFHFRGMNENTGRHAKSLSIESASRLEEGALDEEVAVRSQPSRPPNDLPSSNRNDKALRSSLSKEEIAAYQASMAQMKDRFAKLLLGEDMSGGGKGVSSALALSNAITNLAASIFGEQSRLEPMADERKARWKREIDWLLSATDHIVELVPSQQKNKDGANMEIMVTKQRTDLHMNIPALRTLDTMLIDCLDSFKDQNEFYYLSKDAPDSEKGNNKRKDDKWWLPTVKVPKEGLSDASRKNLQSQKESVTQVLKAAMSINAQVLSEMEVPENYIESLPKNGRASLGDSIYRSITVEFFDPDQFLSTMDLSSEHKILDLKNRIEASIIIWKRKMNQKDGKSTWSSAVSFEKRELFEERAETILHIIKHRFPGLPQSSLEISKIQYNQDVGQAVLESYSRILESLAFTVLSRIEDVLSADYTAQNPSQASNKRNPLKDDSQPTSVVSSPRCDVETTNLMTLSDLLTWSLDQNDSEEKMDSTDDLSKDGDAKHMQKLNIVTNKKVSYLESLGGLRSPTARH
ncbi:rop guanine nucleotide exchange factor 12-like isoform X2 [Durio zibethinus]|uniref:Rop guanine nucleotide exchange factor 12-like isoform X2 n=1 Tax=Durio zibethinus TaxID=66656 RepID=A0A6P5WXZ0_DURZI|nr:rop guanine nucleotide exchange factor 12-like isoform X2 [Durio zibethinus]